MHGKTNRRTQRITLQLIGDIVDHGVLGDHLAIQFVGDMELHHGRLLLLRPLLHPHLTECVVADADELGGDVFVVGGDDGVGDGLHLHLHVLRENASPDPPSGRRPGA